MTRKLTVADYMTIVPYSIGLDESIAAAARRMRQQGIRHLPVLEGGVLYGVLSERDIAMVEALSEERSHEITVEEAMSPEPYIVAMSMPLARVARTMAEQKYGCAVVTEGEQIRGILTTTDALTALADLLEDRGAAREPMAPSEARAVILAEHLHLRALLDRTEAVAQRAALSDVPEQQRQTLRDVMRNLARAVTAHIELENRVLAPVLAELPGYGKLRAERMLKEHEQQQREFDDLLLTLDEQSQGLLDLVMRVEAFVAHLRRDMELEEASLLSSELLKDDDVTTDCFTG